MKTGILVAVVIYEILSMAIPVWYLARKARQARAGGEENFAMAGRSMSWYLVGVTLALTVLGSAHVFGLMEQAWDMGAVALWFSFAHVILLCVVCISTGRWVRRLNVATVPELIERMYDRKTRLVIACVMAGPIFGCLTMETQASGICFATMTGSSIRTGALIGGLLGILYVIVAGMKEVGWVNLINSIIMYIGLIIAAIYITMGLGGDWSSVQSYYLQQNQPWMLSIFGTPKLLFSFGLGTVLSIVFAHSISQMLLQTAMSAKDEVTVKRAMWVAAPVNGLFGVFTVAIGLAAKANVSTNALGPKMAGPTLIMQMLPPWVIVWLLASFLGAILSTFAMTTLTPATIFVKDLYVRLKHPNATEAEQTKMIRIVIVVLAFIAMCVATMLPPMVKGIVWLFAWLVPIFWVVVFGLFWKRSTWVAMTVMFVSWVLNMAWSFTPLPSVLHLEVLENGHITFAVSLLLSVVLLAFAKGKIGYFRALKNERGEMAAATAK
ncbi:MAG: Na+/solute symporter [Acidobacteria bacterium]|nr:Na+/solute symporter [Acidobacteriota bacterium]